MVDAEIDAITKINEALASLEDPDAQMRVLTWAFGKYGKNGAPGTGYAPSQVSPTGTGLALPSNRVSEIPGVACITDSGEFRLTARDIKARSTNDAAVRIAHVVAHAYEQLLGEKGVSSKNVLVPILREWRAYTPNTRSALASHRGLIRNGDLISLDAHSKKEAEKYLAEILDDSVESRWQPNSKSSRKKAKKGTASTESED